MEREIQRYISKELTHFTGQGKRKESQYQLLIKILREGWIAYPKHNTETRVGLAINPNAKISQNEMYLPQMVCFCDIPVEDLTLHKKNTAVLEFHLIKTSLYNKVAFLYIIYLLNHT